MAPTATATAVTTMAHGRASLGDTIIRLYGNPVAFTAKIAAADDRMVARGRMPDRQHNDRNRRGGGTASFWVWVLGCFA
jgi:mevalonate kinase